MPLEADTYKGIVESTRRMGRLPGSQVLVRFIFSGNFDIVEGKALKDKDGNVVTYERGDHVGVTYDPSRHPQEVVGMCKLKGFEVLFDDGSSGEFM